MRRTADDLVVCWSPALERAGAVQGLSGFVGQSSLRSWGAIEPLTWEDPALRPERAPPTFWDTTRDPEAWALLRKGVSLRATARMLGITLWCMRSIVRRKHVAEAAAA